MSASYARYFYGRKRLSWTLKIGPISCSETPVRNYHYSRNNPKERSCHLLRGESPKSRVLYCTVLYSPLLNSKAVIIHGMKSYRGSRVMAPLILNLDTTWRWVVQFTRRPLYLRVPNEYQASWATGHVWSYWRRGEKFPCRNSSPEPSSP